MKLDTYFVLWRLNIIVDILRDKLDQFISDILQISQCLLYIDIVHNFKIYFIKEPNQKNIKNIRVVAENYHKVLANSGVKETKR